MKSLIALVLTLAASAAFAQSANNTVVSAGSAATITDAAGKVWGINSTAPCTATWATKGSISEDTQNGTLDATSCQVAKIAYVSGVVWQENTSGNWYPWSGSAWGAAQTASPITAPLATATLTWAAPTTNTNGSAITQALTYNIYRGSSATSLSLLSTTSTTTYVDQAGSTTPVTYYYAVTAVEAGTQGAQSNIVSDTIAAAALVPSAVTLSVH